MFTVRMLVLIISTAISLYSGITTALFARGKVRTWCEPKPLAYEDGTYVYSSGSFPDTICSAKNVTFWEWRAVYLSRASSA